MKFPPKRISRYIFDNGQDKRIFKKLMQLEQSSLDAREKKLIALLFSQLENDWRTPLEKFVDILLKSKKA